MPANTPIDGGKRKPKNSVRGITGVSVSGYKSISEERRIDIRRLTILAGANSSGKSSILQPSLLLKQTIETSYDAASLNIAGSNISFTAFDQLLSKMPALNGGRNSASCWQSQLN